MENETLITGGRNISRFERSEAVQEIVSNRPGVIIRYGILFFLAILLALGIASWFIQYPETVRTSARLNSINAAREVIARTDGKLVKIAVRENTIAREGQVLGYMETIARVPSVVQMKAQVDSLISLTDQNRADETSKFLPGYNHSNFIKNLGELQAPYQEFAKAYIRFNDFLNTGFYVRKKHMLQADLLNIQKLHTILADQKILLEQDVSLSNETFGANETLAKEKVISALDYRSEKSKLITKQLSLPQINASIVSNEGQENEKRKEIAELENQIIVEKNTFIQSLQTMKSMIQAWEFKYLLKAPVAGTVSFAGFFQENEEMKSGQPLFFVQPDNTAYFIEMMIPQYNFGKVKPGQQVLLKFQAYPFEQYGSVLGKIDYIKSSPTDSGFQARVVLPRGLTTNHGKTIPYRYGLTAQADIITEDMRLFHRFYYMIARQVTQ